MAHPAQLTVIPQNKFSELGYVPHVHPDGYIYFAKSTDATTGIRSDSKIESSNITTQEISKEEMPALDHATKSDANYVACSNEYAEYTTSHQSELKSEPYVMDPRCTSGVNIEISSSYPDNYVIKPKRVYSSKKKQFNKVHVDSDPDDIIQESPKVAKGTYLRKRARNHVLYESWRIKFQSMGYISCHFSQCRFLAMSLKDMVIHYGYCSGDSSFAKFRCFICGGAVTTNKILNIHIERSHHLLPKRTAQDVTILARAVKLRKKQEVPPHTLPLPGDPFVAPALGVVDRYSESEVWQPAKRPAILKPAMPRRMDSRTLIKPLERCRYRPQSLAVEELVLKLEPGGETDVRSSVIKDGRSLVQATENNSGYDTPDSICLSDFAKAEPDFNKSGVNRSREEPVSPSCSRLVEDGISDKSVKLNQNIEAVSTEPVATINQQALSSVPSADMTTKDIVEKHESGSKSKIIDGAHKAQMFIFPSQDVTDKSISSTTLDGDSCLRRNKKGHTKRRKSSAEKPNEILEKSGKNPEFTIKCKINSNMGISTPKTENRNVDSTGKRQSRRKSSAEIREKVKGSKESPAINSENASSPALKAGIEKALTRRKSSLENDEEVRITTRRASTAGRRNSVKIISSSASPAKAVITEGSRPRRKSAVGKSHKVKGKSEENCETFITQERTFEVGKEDLANANKRETQNRGKSSDEKDKDSCHITVNVEELSEKRVGINARGDEMPKQQKKFSVRNKEKTQIEKPVVKDVELGNKDKVALEVTSAELTVEKVASDRTSSRGKSNKNEKQAIFEGIFSDANASIPTGIDVTDNVSSPEISFGKNFQDGLKSATPELVDKKSTSSSDSEDTPLNQRLVKDAKITGTGTVTRPSRHKMRHLRIRTSRESDSESNAEDKPRRKKRKRDFSSSSDEAILSVMARNKKKKPSTERSADGAEIKKEISAMDDSTALSEFVEEKTQEVVKRKVGRPRNPENINKVVVKKVVVKEVTIKPEFRRLPDLPVTCGKCSVSVVGSMWEEHNAKQHAGLGWLSDEAPFDPAQTDSKEVLIRIRSAFRFIKSATCDKCGTIKKSFLGFHAHVMICGKTNEDLLDVLVKCKECGKAVMPYSLVSHMKMHSAQEFMSEVQTGLPSKRRSAVQALSNIKKVVNDEVKTTSSFRKGDNLPVSWKDLSVKLRNGMVCDRKGCGLECDSRRKFCEHYFQCPMLPDQFYYCSACFFIGTTEKEVKKHTCKLDQCDKEDDYDASTDEDTLVEEGIQGRIYATGTSISILENQFRKRCLERERMNPHKGSIYPRAFELELERQKQLLTQDREFPNLTTRREDWKKLPEKERRPFMPPVAISLPVTFKMTDANTQRVPVFKPFESKFCIAGFAGGPIQTLAWCPVDMGRSGTTHQYLALSTSSQTDHYPLIRTNLTKTALLQIWDVGPLLAPSESQQMAKMAVGIAMNFGELWEIAWSPNDTSLLASEDRLARIGLVATACHDGKIRIYSVSCPTDDDDNDESPVYSVSPAVELFCDTDSDDDACLRVSWGEGGVICGGFRSGNVAVWYLDAVSASSTFKSASTYLLRAPRVFLAHSSPVSCVSLSYSDSNLLVTGGVDRKVHFWNLKSLGAPLRTESAAMNCMLKWMRHWPVQICHVDDNAANFFTSRGCVMHGVGLKTASYIKDICVSDWTFLSAYGLTGGELVVRQNVDPFIDNRRLMYTQIPTLAKCSESSGSYADANSKNTTIILQTRVTDTKLSLEAVSNTELNGADISLASLDKVAINPNYMTFDHIALGYHCGFFRLIKIAHVSNAIEKLNRQQPSAPIS